MAEQIYKTCDSWRKPDACATRALFTHLTSRACISFFSRARTQQGTEMRLLQTNGTQACICWRCLWPTAVFDVKQHPFLSYQPSTENHPTSWRMSVNSTGTASGSFAVEASTGCWLAPSAFKTGGIIGIIADTGTRHVVCKGQREHKDPFRSRDTCERYGYCYLFCCHPLVTPPPDPCKIK